MKRLGDCLLLLKTRKHTHTHAHTQTAKKQFIADRLLSFGNNEGAEMVGLFFLVAALAASLQALPDREGAPAEVPAGAEK